MNIKLLKRRTFTACLSVLGMAVLVLSSCNDDFLVKVEKHDPGDTVSVDIPQRKVLYLIVDGLRGRIIPQINPPALIRMINNSTYTFDGLSDKSGIEATDWANMLTGVHSDKHKVTSSDFSGNDLQHYPMFFTRLKQTDPKYHTASFTSSSVLHDHLISDADINKTFNGNDEAVSNAIVDELRKDEEITAVFGEFNSVKNAGQQYGYDSSSQGYVQAIMDVDSYIDDILTALRSRKNYAHEDWLVVVASDKGGMTTIPPEEVDNSIFGNSTLNSFVIFYNPRFAGKIITKPNVANLPYEGYAIKLHDKGDDAVRVYLPPDSATLYNFGTSGEYTVQVKVKVFDFGTTWPSFFGKRQSSYNRSTEEGWMFMFHGDEQWRLKIGGSGHNLSTAVQNFKAEEWHVLTMKIYNEGGKRLAAIYTDGNKGTPVDITGMDLDNQEPLAAGWSDGWTSTQSELYITDIKIWKTALPDNVIANNGGRVGLDPSSPYFADIIGYWPGTDGIGEGYKDYGPFHHDMIFNLTTNNKGSFNWEHFSDLSGLIFPPLPTDLEQTVPRGVDIPYMIYKWMGIDAASWDLDGKFWLPGYTDVQ